MTFVNKNQQTLASLFVNFLWTVQKIREINWPFLKMWALP